MPPPLTPLAPNPIAIGKIPIMVATAVIKIGRRRISPACSIASRIRFENAEAGRHTLELLIVDQDGRPLFTRLRRGAKDQGLRPPLQ